MRIQRSYQLLPGLLLVALVAAGCVAPGSSSLSPTPVPPTVVATTIVEPTTAPTMEPTSPPAPTTEPATPPPATVEPTVPAATVAPTAPTPVGSLPANVPWVRSGATIAAPGGQALNLEQLGQPVAGNRAVAASDGSYIAYVGQQDQLLVLDLGTGHIRSVSKAGTSVVGFSFTTDNRNLAFTVIDGEKWRLQALDLASGDTYVIQEDVIFGSAGRPPTLVLRPLAWTADGILVDRLMWATDGPPQGLALVDPDTGAVTALRDAPHLEALPAPDGRRIALLSGSVPIGGTPIFAIAIFDAGQETTIVPEQPGFVKELRWSSDGVMLLYAASASYDVQATSVRAINADGSNEQRIDFGALGLDYFFRDLAWHDHETPLVLVARTDQRLELHELPIHSFDLNSLKLLGTFDAPQTGNVTTQILYVPHS